MRMLRAADLIGSGTEAEAYLRVARERYRLMRTHEWNDEVIAAAPQGGQVGGHPAVQAARWPPGRSASRRLASRPA